MAVRISGTRDPGAAKVAEVLEARVLSERRAVKDDNSICACLLMDSESAENVRLVLSIGDLEVYQVGDGEGAIVTRRIRKRRDRWECGCGEASCGHIAAAKEFSSTVSRPPKDDPSVVAAFEEEIAGLRDRIESDPDYLDEEEANALYCETAEREKRNGTYRYDMFYEPVVDYPNEDVEYDVVKDLGTRVLTQVRNPHEAIRLVEEMNRVTRGMPYQYDGFEHAYSELVSDHMDVFGRADVQDLVLLLSGDCDYWKLDLLDGLPPALVDAAYAALRGGHVHSRLAQDMMLDRGDFEDYMASGGDIEVAVDKLVQRGDEDRARRLCEAVDVGSIPDYEAWGCAGAFDSVGLGMDAGKLYLRAYLHDGSKEAFSKFTWCASKVPALLDYACETEAMSNPHHLRMLTYLVKEGREEAVRMAASADPSSFADRNGSYDVVGACGLCSALIGVRKYAVAYPIGRAAVEAYLRSPGWYSSKDALDVLEQIGSRKSFEKLDPPYTAWIDGLRTRYPEARLWKDYDYRMSGRRRRDQSCEHDKSRTGMHPYGRARPQEDPRQRHVREGPQGDAEGAGARVLGRRRGGLPRPGQEVVPDGGQTLLRGQAGRVQLRLLLGVVRACGGGDHIPRRGAVAGPGRREGRGEEHRAGDDSRPFGSRLQRERLLRERLSP